MTIEMLLEYYTSRLRKSIYKSLMRKCLHELKFDESLILSIIDDEKTTRKDLSLYGTDYTEQDKNFQDYKNKDRHVRRTMEHTTCAGNFHSLWLIVLQLINLKA